MTINRTVKKRRALTSQNRCGKEIVDIIWLTHLLSRKTVNDHHHQLDSFLCLTNFIRARCVSLQNSLITSVAVANFVVFKVLMVVRFVPLFICFKSSLLKFFINSEIYCDDRNNKYVILYIGTVLPNTPMSTFRWATVCRCLSKK